MRKSGPLSGLRGGRTWRLGHTALLWVLGLSLPARGDSKKTTSPVAPIPARAFGAWDYAATAAALGAFYVVEFAMEVPSRPSWTKPVALIDEPVRNLLVLDSRRARDRADALSDYFSYPVVAYPVAVALLSPLLSDQPAKLQRLWSLSMMNLQVYSVSSVINRLTHKTVGRSRPSEVGCAQDEGYDRLCGSRAQNAGFIGGHVTTAAAGAGLTCAHHLHANLIGNHLADSLACGAAITTAGLVFIARLQADRHWLSDNLAGAVAGLAAGYGLPTLLYYQPFWWDRATDKGSTEYRKAPSWTLLPNASVHGVGAMLTGRF